MHLYRRLFLPACTCLALVGWALAPASAGAQAKDHKDQSPGGAPATPSPQSPAAPAPEEPNLSEAGVQLSALVTPGGMTAEAAAKRAVQTAPSIDEAKASALQAQAAADQAWLGVLPRLDLTASYARLSNIKLPQLIPAPTAQQIADLQTHINSLSDPNAQYLWNQQLAQTAALGSYTFPVILNQYLLRAQVSYPVSDLFLTILPGYRAARTASEAQQAQVTVEQATVALDARQAFYSYARARGAELVAEASLAQAQAQQKQVDNLVAAGAAARVEGLRAAARVASAQVAVARTKGGVRVAVRSLQTLLHLPPNAPIGIGEDLSVMPPEVKNDEPTLVAKAQQQRPEIKSLELLVDARDRQARAQAGAQWPHLGVQAEYDYENPNPRIIPQHKKFDGTWEVGVALTWSPNDLLDARKGADQTRAEAMKAEADLRSLQDAVEIQVTRSYEDLKTARDALQAAQTGITAAEENYRVRFQQLKAGAAVTTDLVDADAELTRSRLELLNAAIDVHLAYAQLMRAVTGKAEY